MQDTTTPLYTPVVILGGSLVGLSAALFLSWRGIKPIVIEKHRGSAQHPRAVGFTERTLEHYRATGIADQIPQVAAGMRLRRVRADSLSGTWHEESSWTPGQAEAEPGMPSPVTGAAIAQDKLEPILRQAALAQGADLRQGVEMLSVEHDQHGVLLTVRERDREHSYCIRADYLIAADGADSPVRETLGIARTGVGHLRTLRSVLFRCPEADPFLEKGIQQFSIEQPNFRGFLTSYGDGRWVLMFDDQAYTEADLAGRVRQALGADFAFDILTTGRWELAGRIAQHYSEGRVFLAGDAAHQLPPTRGGFGANTGIDDVWNLAFKLAWVIKGYASPRLLDTYNAERQPIGWLRHQQTFARPDYAQWAGDALKGEALYSNAAMELGQLYRSSAIIGADATLPPAAHPDDWAGQPGTRAPHFWVQQNAQNISTVDLFKHELVLLTEDSRWLAPACAAAAAAGLPFTPQHVGVDVVFDSAKAFAHAFGVPAGGATLVRPDGIVAWRCGHFAPDAIASLTAAMQAIMGNPG
ncbi:FAD-dependent monooxygenase [Massilia sp. CF038]|uniref:FAD-dependent monooxygenase n=1 Tax=Massilia sp. CF038 TaxID=1881045 RepID=UPI000923E6D4|nr:FAD-dependent monooxygenase [Massilia sp. CF038]SHH09304.1 2-polyprenyl-6-methoxyphenol hydroxylase [Massilia sp. CF038]